MSMPRRSGPAAVIAGLGSWVPPRVVDNAELASRWDITDEWIRTRTGIHRRRVVDPGVSTVDLAVEAGGRAVKSAQSGDRGAGPPGESAIGAVVLATTTPDRPCPASAPEVASRLGLVGVAAMDVAAVCTGFLYGLATGAGLISVGVAEQVLVIGADTFSTILDPDDHTTGAIFGDGAGAVVLRAGHPDEPGGLGPFDLGSDGDGAELIMIPGGGSRQRSRDGRHADADHYFRMNGRPVFRRAVAQMAASARLALDRVGWDLSDVDRFVGHQANARILRAVGENLGLAPEQIVSNIDSVGNTAAASIPLALADASRSGQIEAGHRVLLSAFGGGITWGSTTLVWPAVTAV